MVLYVDLDSLPASTLRHLAALREERERSSRHSSLHRLPGHGRGTGDDALRRTTANHWVVSTPPSASPNRHHQRKSQERAPGGQSPPSPPASIGTYVRAAPRASSGGSHAWAT